MPTEPESDTTLDTHIGHRLRLRRKATGMSLQALADRSGISLPQIQRYETGSNRLGVARLYSLAEALEVDLDYFVEGFGHVGHDRNASASPGPGKESEVAELMRSEFGVKLALAMTRIESRDLRNQLLDLTRSLDGL